MFKKTSHAISAPVWINSGPLTGRESKKSIDEIVWTSVSQAWAVMLFHPLGYCLLHASRNMHGGHGDSCIDGRGGADQRQRVQEQDMLSNKLQEEDSRPMGGLHQNAGVMLSGVEASRHSGTG
eukprot:1155627-Pelagomonas_calceolata.AAC.5